MYECEFDNNVPEGEGIHYYENGDYYVGSFKKGGENGKGKLFGKDRKIKYEGDWANGVKEGNGKEIYGIGDYYVGEFKNDLKNGKGKLFDMNNNIKYEGNWVDDKFEEKNNIFN